ncbi:MAG: redox-regulated ATPase YchF [Patescibacteria group bacterium]|nr:redox-regulated ATPase YchF [Patescibacteria group bacterium]
MLKIGIVGLPNVGKSTLFNALMGKAQAAASNFPFCTIEPNVGSVPVPDERLNVLADFEKSEKVIPTAIEFVDIAGLVKGASEGQGLGNQFLSHIREVDAIIEVVRLFENSNITHVGGKIDPKDDADTIGTELLLADIQSLEKRVIKMEKEAKTDPSLKPQFDFYLKLKQYLDAGSAARSLELSDKEKVWMKEMFLLTNKPILYVANVDENQLKDAGIAQEIANKLGVSENEVLIVNAKAEEDIAALSPEDQKSFLDDLGLAEPGLNKIIRAGYALLDLITFLTAGPKETRAWTIEKGAKAPQAAGVIHTDFEKGFIRAEVISFDDIKEAGGWKEASSLGKLRQEGKDYIFQDGDVTHFKFNV